MRYLLLLLGLISTAYGQFAPTSAKTAFKNGISIGTKDSAAYVSADSLVVVINRQGRMMYRSTDGYWKILSNAGGSDFVPYTGAVDNVALGNYRLTARSIRMDSIYANGSGGAVVVTNSGTRSFSWGAGGSSEVTFYGFGGYDANRAGSYTARSFTDKNYVDSSQIWYRLSTLGGSINAKINDTLTGYIQHSPLSLGVTVNGKGNTAIGFYAGTKNFASGVLGFHNTFLGSSAGEANDSGYQNTAIGHRSLVSNVGGYQNTAVGQGALFSSNSNGNAAFGFHAGLNVTGEQNTFIGTRVAETSGTQSGAYNTFGGYVSGHDLTSGIENTAWGRQSLYSITSGNYNTAKGSNAGFFNTTGSGNTYLGHSSGVTTTTANANISGSNNTHIGYQSGAATSTQISNAVSIGYQSLATASNQFILGNSFHSVGIRTSNPLNKLQIGNAATYSGNDFAISNGTNDFAITQDNTAANIYSTNGIRFYPSTAELLRLENNEAIIGGTDFGAYRFQVGGNMYVGTTSELGGVASYSSNLASSYTNRSLIDKRYADSSIALKYNTADMVTTATASKGVLRGASAEINATYGVFSSGTTFINATSTIPSVSNGKLIVKSSSADFVVGIQANTSTGNSFGPMIQAGTNSSDISFLLRDANNTNDYIKVLGDGKVQLFSSIAAKKVIGNSSAPSVSLGSNITGSVSVTGTDLAGTITVTVTGASGLATLNELFTLTYNSAYSSTPHVVFSPASTGSTVLQRTPGLYLKNSGTSSFQIAITDSYTTPASATYSFTYHVIQ